VKSYKVSACCGVFTKHCNFNTKTDSPPSANGETPQKFLQQLAVVLSYGNRFLKMTTMAFKEEINVFHGYFKEFNVLLD